MDLKPIDAALAGYVGLLDKTERARLTFFREIWEVQAEIAAQRTGVAYAVPDARDLRFWSAEHIPALRRAPVSIEAGELVESVERIVACMLDKGGFAPEACEVLASIGWDDRVRESPLETAGSNPAAYGERLCRELLDEGADAAGARVAASAVSLALRALLENAARALQDARVRAAAGLAHSVMCPICGTHASVARVGASAGKEGRGKTLWCAQCGTIWEFDRVRCARCGTRNQARLHYLSIEGDDAHRIATCDECGGYIRTVYQDDALAPFSFEVEDVVMAKLDHIVARGLAGWKAR